MRFKYRFSEIQRTCIELFVFALLLMFLAPVVEPEAMRFLGAFLFVGSIFMFFREASRKYTISHPFAKNEYKSQAERDVASYFQRKKIIFKYEPRVKLHTKFFLGGGVPFCTEVVRPDFFLPEFEVFVEVTGMLDDPGYAIKLDKKKTLYKENGIECIYLKPADDYDYKFTFNLLKILKERQGIQLHSW